MNQHILIVGAGPAGLSTALTLARNGHSNITIIDKRNQVTDHTKAIILWAGAMQTLDYLGVYDDIVGQAIPLPATSYEWSSGRQRTIALGIYQSGFPHPAISVPQPVVERALEDALTATGITVTRQTEALSVHQNADTVAVETSRGPLHADWLIGADGAHSAVRAASDINFDGDALSDCFFLADGTPKNPVAHRARYLLDSPHATVVSVPLPSDRCRVFVRRPHGAEPLSATNINDYLRRTGHAELQLSTIDWSSEFPVAERLASSLRAGRSILVGDAAHIHSPAGGQGLNAGVQDGHTLGIALGRALRFPDTAETELDVYATRRRTAAKQAIDTTRRQLGIWTARTRAQRIARYVSLFALSRLPRLQEATLSRTAQQDALQLSEAQPTALRRLTTDLRAAIRHVASSGLDDTLLVAPHAVPPETIGVRQVRTSLLVDPRTTVRIRPDLTVVEVD